LNFEILVGDNRDTLKTLDDNSVDAIVTDPPYGIDFLGKSWDANTGAVETYTECLRVLKPGGHILAFSAARTYHHLAVTLEQAGFEIRDQLMWLYSSGFPKAQDIGKAIDKRLGHKDDTVLVAPTFGTNGEKIVKNSADGQLRCPVCKKTSEQRYHCGKGDDCGMVFKPQTPEAQKWAGWKTALKPAHEPICMARKPFKGSTIDNVLTHGVGALNIDATRIDNLTDVEKNWTPQRQHAQSSIDLGGAKPGDIQSMYNDAGRFPSNVIGEVEGYQKFFYCPKVNRKERHCGFEQKDIPGIGGGNQMAQLPGDKNSKLKAVEKASAGVGNNHPTVKPVELMKYLIKLVTPPNSTVLDPFNGSGSTGMAAVELGHTYIGCELDPNYVDIATRRITAWNTHELDNTFSELFDYD